MTPNKAYFKAKESGTLPELEEIVITDPEWAYYYARDIPYANVVKLYNAVKEDLIWGKWLKIHYDEVIRDIIE